MRHSFILVKYDFFFLFQNYSKDTTKTKRRNKWINGWRYDRQIMKKKNLNLLQLQIIKI